MGNVGTPVSNLRGGLSFNGRKPRPLFVSKSAGDPRPEHDIQESFFHWLKLNEPKYPELSLFYAIPNAGRRTPWERGRLLGEGLRAGLPDTHLPIARNGHAGLWIEFKSAKGRLSPAQQRS